MKVSPTRICGDMGHPVDLGSTSLIITTVQIPEEDLAVGAGRDEQAVRGAPGAHVDVGQLLVAGEPLP